jgi:hypothetical protein
MTEDSHYKRIYLDAVNHNKHDGEQVTRMLSILTEQPSLLHDREVEKSLVLAYTNVRKYCDLPKIMEFRELITESDLEDKSEILERFNKVDRLVGLS